MSLQPGSRFGAFDILSAIGAGGMGEVYLCRDSKLNRDVAIKVLLPDVANDAERLARFRREAHVLASLNHPNIGAIYGLEESDAVTGLVLELVDGTTLAEKIGSGLPLDEALKIARQIADALDAAHEKGVIHRDLKPANVKVTRDGVVKVLDFGLAKASAGESERASLSVEATVRMGTTGAGVILGTAAYMSPEQARGLPVDKRADIWAFGCVLYEMLAGRLAFGGSTISDILVNVLARDPEWAALPPSTPAAIERLLRRCCEKDPKRRLRDIGDARAEIDEAMDGAAGTAVSSVTAIRPPVNFQRLTDFAGMNESPALSPDSKMVAFVAPIGGWRQIWIRLLAGGAPLQITRDDADHERPRWTPDSSALIYYTPSATPGEEGALWEIAALGGLPRPIAASLGGGDVSHSSRRLAFFQFCEGRADLVTSARDGSDMTLVTRGLPGRSWDCPRWSPDDRWLAFQDDVDGLLAGRLLIAPAAGGDAREVKTTSSLRGTSWLPDGSGLVYSSALGSTVPYPPTSNLRAVGFDGTGDRQLMFGDMSYVAPDVHASGKVVSCRIRSRSDIWKFPVSGSPAENTRDAVRITRQTGQVQTPSVSPNGSEIVYLSDNGGHGNLWITGTDGSRVRQLTFERDPDMAVGVPLWSPAGDRIAFVYGRYGSVGPGIWTIRPDGRNLRELIPCGRAACWSRDGQWLYYAALSERGTWQMDRIEKISASGGTPVHVRSGTGIHAPMLSDNALYFAVKDRPDLGNWDWDIHRASPEDGPSEVVTRIAGARLPLSTSFVSANVSPDGAWLALPLADGATTNLWAFPSAGGPARQLTDFGDQPTIIARQVSWSPDGQFLYAAVAETEGDVILLEGLL